MYDKLAADLAALPALLDAARAQAGELLAGLDDRPVAGRPGAGRAPLPIEGAGARAALAEFARRWAPGLSGSAGPRYLGLVTGGATPAALAGDWLTAAADQNAASSVDSCAAGLEHETVGWLAQLFGLGPEFSGAFVSGATMSTVVGLAIGREWAGERLGVRVADEGFAALGPVEVLSGAAHASVGKAMAMLGFGRSARQQVPLQPGREAVDVAALDRRLGALGGRPAIVVANAGTVDTVDFDDLRAIAGLKRRHDFWLHVDAAFGGFAALSPEHAALVDGLDRADSVCVDLHKWLNVPYDSAVQFSRRLDLQTRVFQSSAAYLGEPGEDPDFIHRTPESSRRLRALAAWCTLAAYGREGHREIVERCVANARDLGSRLSGSPRWRLLAPVRLNVVCFTLAEDPMPERIGAVVRAVAAGGETSLTPTVHAGVPALRAAFSNWRTETADVGRIFTALDSAGA
ncbi:pyridoxal-dependent decarboxylase [Amycolatopsis sp. PS_44_ISF1]|uniref:pyridoxal phosphate-dependent decarboxylase family protein n=1 Tax=Amycolatopsis sp. PS_44_ISF1 TaxID=2974917 RepID=UPI0028E04A91|nr:pyridoxal-dependent decarboxylase [Amycolatopsis sp. PS_44_ISF1]MDT8914920.1 pyridoxal-dependent decarboxylase [Amycolatopsis sp. PS_44_ISF1]